MPSQDEPDVSAIAVVEGLAPAQGRTVIPLSDVVGEAIFLGLAFHLFFFGRRQIKAVARAELQIHAVGRVPRRAGMKLGLGADPQFRIIGAALGVKPLFDGPTVGVEPPFVL